MTKTSTFQEGKPTFLLDVDGVLANFVQGMIDSHSLSISHDEYITWDMHRTLGKDALTIQGLSVWKCTVRI